ncbi:MAG: alpha-1,2-fucosyltransferase [Chitinophagaceae bacterium]
MIVSKLISGLGNQLFQYTIGRQLSIKRNVPLKLDVSFFNNQQLRSYKLDHYNIHAEVASDRDIERFTNIYKRRSFYARLYRKAEKLLPKNKRLYYKEGEWWIFEPGLLHASSNVYVDGYWQHYRYFEKVDPRIREELTLKQPYDKSPAIIGEILGNESSVSLHIRRGDYITDPNAYNFMGVMPVEYYYTAMNYIIEKGIRPSFYIFSDDLDWVRDNIKVHAPLTCVDLDGGNKDYIELDLMSKCRHNIIANSSFSWWGAFLNRNPGKIVIAPSQWVKPEEVNKKIELQFPSWIKM